MSYNTEITINNFNNIDMAIHGYGSFINGYYLQRGNCFERSYSFLKVNKDGVEKSVFRNLNDNMNNIFNFSNYGDFIKRTSQKLVSINISGIELNKNKTVTSEIGDYYTDLSNFHGMNSIINTEINSKSITNRRVKLTRCGVSPVLIQAVSASLFKSLGKTASIINSNEIKNLDYLLSSGVKQILDEHEVIKSSSNFLKIYGNSNRIEYVNGVNNKNNCNNINFNFNSNHGFKFNRFNYNLHNANFDFKVKLSGRLDNNSESNTFYNKVLRSLGTDNLINYDNNNKSLSYSINIFMRLTHRDDMKIA